MQKVLDAQIQYNNKMKIYKKGDVNWSIVLSILLLVVAATAFLWWFIRPSGGYMIALVDTYFS